MTIAAKRAYLVLETIAIFGLNKFGAGLAVATAGVVGLVLPDMPLLRHTYLAFGTIVSLGV